ncbi:sec-independent protein translocase protein TatB [Kaistia hirudinis]|uniref:Sec-independent protein translocase protein TatB n=1 Tax=Kaistia hirudinis TaxID=1293440 RepID=A0A840AIP1_9HYPH|nr:Sec-independent protein translocase protein TatB [Kaistia hirudinis]MBB3929193.1 sec-independent protein translocase protein TatB [Kaistia hirudinis]
MFDIGWSEILVIVVVAIVVVGPKDLPPMLRAAGRMVAKMRRTAGEFQSQFNEALREAELDGVKESIDQIRGLNPLNDIKKSLDPIQAALSSPTPIAKPAPEPVPPPAGQDAQPVSDGDISPAAPPALASPDSTAAPIETAPLASAPEAVPVPVAAGAADEAAPAKRASRRKAVPAGGAEAATDAAEAIKDADAPVKKPRAPRKKPVAVSAEAGEPVVDAPETVPAAEATTTPEGRSA